MFTNYPSVFKCSNIGSYVGFSASGHMMVESSLHVAYFTLSLDRPAYTYSLEPTNSFKK